MTPILSNGIIYLFTTCLLVVSVWLATLIAFGLVGSFTVLILVLLVAVGTYKTVMCLIALDYVLLEEFIELSSILERLAIKGPLVTTRDLPSYLENERHVVPRSKVGFQQCDGLAVPEVDRFVKYIMRDFIRSWYHGSISANDQFTREIQYALEDISVALVSRTRKLNAHLMLTRAVRIYHNYFLDYLAAVRRTTLRNRCASRSAEAHAISDGATRTSGRPDLQENFTGWHLALTFESDELRFLQNVVNVLLEVLVPADVLVCPVGRQLLVTILAERVLLPIINLLSDPDWINQKLIVVLGGTDLVTTAQESEGHLPKGHSTASRRSTIPSKMAAEISTVVCEESSDIAYRMDSEDRQKLNRSDDYLQNFTDVIDSEVPIIIPAAVAIESNRLYPPESVALHAEDYGDRISTTEGHGGSPGEAAGGVTDGIWQRMVDELPSAFRNERQQEVSEILQEAATGTGPGALERKRTLKIPLSCSLDKIGDLFSSAMNVEFITGNIAHYFKPPPPVNTEGSPRHHSTSDDGEEGACGDRWTVNDDQVDVAPSQGIHNVSSLLERVIPMSMGPLLPQQLTTNRASRIESNSDIASADGSKSDEQLMILGEVEISAAEEVSSFGLRSEEMALAWKQLANTTDPVFEVTDTSSPSLSELPNQDYTKFEDKLLPESGDSFSGRSTFTNLTIPSTVVIDEPGSGGQYVAYCIKYDAWFRDSDAIKTVDVGCYIDIVEPQTSLHSNYVRRRFREFLALQVRLEEEPLLKPQLKGIKGPNKWSVLPFNKLDKDTVDERRLSLERYLQMLITKGDIPNSHHFREFLAYGCDSSIAYVTKVNDINLPVPRFDKFLMRTMTEVFDKLKTALPSMPHDPSPIEPISNQNKTDRFLGFLNFNSPGIVTGSDSTKMRLSFDYGMDVEYVDRIEDLLNQYLGSYDSGNDKVDEAYDAGDIDAWIEDPWSLPLPSSSEHKVVSESIEGEDQSSNSTRETNNSWDDKFPLASAFINFSAETILDKDVKVDRDNFVFLMKIIFGKVLEKWISDLIDNYMSEEVFAKYLKLVIDTLWPNGVLSELNCDIRTESDKRKSYEVTLQTLKNYFPSLFMLILGKQYDTGMKLFLDSFQHPKLLRNVIYQLLDLLVDSLLIRSRSRSIIDKLGSTS